MNRSDRSETAPEPGRALLTDPDALAAHISRRLLAIGRNEYHAGVKPPKRGQGSSAVMLLVGLQNGAGPCLVLNKRSQRVRQPGDICCPGGGISPTLDRLLSRLLPLPGLPLGRWPHWHGWRRDHALGNGAMPLLLATALREGYEEMGLNPFGVRFLGPMPPFCLRLFQRKIYPMVGWISRQQRFRTNWEVDRIIRIPLSWFWERDRYANYRVSFSRSVARQANRIADDFPCFRFENDGRPEVLWGVTYRIVMNFMASVLGLQPPDTTGLPVISGRLGGRYITGK